jgi:DNA-binding CsgD family transcriptional regulator
MNETRLISDVAEIAVASNSWNEFCGEFVKLYGRFGAESVAFVSVRSFQEVQVTSSVQEDNQPLNASMSRYLSQMSRGELDRALVPRTVGVDEIHPVARREQLGLYTEFLYPRGVHRFALRMWRGASSVHWFASTFPRIGRRRYEALTLAAMDHVFPIVALTERLYAPADRAETGEITREASLRYHLTQAEHDTMCLVGRGLTNSEIASLCGVALPTIRNRIVSCFKKLQVSRRTEAAYILIEASRALPLDPPRATTLSDLVHPPQKPVSHEDTRAPRRANRAPSPISKQRLLDDARAHHALGFRADVARIDRALRGGAEPWVSAVTPGDDAQTGAVAAQRAAARDV